MASSHCIHVKGQKKQVTVWAILITAFTSLVVVWCYSRWHYGSSSISTIPRHHEKAPISDHSPMMECEKRAIKDSTGSNTSTNKGATKGGLVILTPIHNAQEHLPHYFKNLCSLSYPLQQISVVLGEDSSVDRTWGLTQKYLERLRKYFRRVELVDLADVTAHEPWPDSHLREVQLQRRRHLALSRNALLFAGLRQEDWVLWLDVDVREMPSDIIEQLVSQNKDIIVPSCMYRKPITRYPAIYDRNSWRESSKSLEFLKRQPKDYLMLEGYNLGLRDNLAQLSREGLVVKLDGVGGCMLLIKADCHRKGLIFPPFVYNHHIETEGLAKMAKDMGFGVYGMPKLFVFHN